jgi:predicted GNAT family N-acyltransferase
MATITPYPEFYDPQWVKRGIYSDHIIWMVIEDEGHIVASGACILNFGDYNDQIGEIGRLVVDPEVGGRGLGRQILTALGDPRCGQWQPRKTSETGFFGKAWFLQFLPSAPFTAAINSSR